MLTPPDPRKSAGPKLRINRMIRAREVRVIGSEGEHLGRCAAGRGIRNGCRTGARSRRSVAGCRATECKIIDYDEVSHICKISK